MTRSIGLVVLAALGVTALTACMGDGDSSSRRERRSAALEDETTAAGYMRLTIAGITPAGKVIDVRSFSWDAQPRGQFGDFKFVHTSDETSPMLFRGVATGSHYANAVLKLFIEGEPPYNWMTFELTNVVVTGVHPSGSAMGDVNARPFEEVTLSYDRVLERVTLHGSPNASFCWDLVSLRSC